MSSIFAEARRLIRVQTLAPNSPMIEQALGRAQTHHQFAAAYLALWGYRRKKPAAGDALNDFTRTGIRLAEDVLTARLNGKDAEAWACWGKLGIEGTGARFKSKDVARAVAGQGFVCTKPIEATPSEAARREAKAERERLGKVYRGPRFVPKKARQDFGSDHYSTAQLVGLI